MRPFKNNIIYRALAALNRLLPKKLKIRGVAVLISLGVGSFLELFGLASLIPLFTFIFQDDALSKNPYLNQIYLLTGFESEGPFILFLCTTIILVIIIKNILSLLISYFQASFVFSLFHYFSSRLMKLYYGKGLLFFKKTNSNQLARNINDVPYRFAKEFVLQILLFLNEIIILILIVLGIFIYYPKVVLMLMVVVVPVTVLFYHKTKRKVQSFSEKQYELSIELLKTVFQGIFGYIDIILSNKTNWIFSSHSYHIRLTQRLQTWLHVIGLAPLKIIETSMILGVLSIVYYGFFFMDDQSELVLLLGIFALAAYRILPSVSRILSSLIVFKGNEYTLDIISTVQYDGQEIGEVERLPFHSEISLENISFNYPDRSEKVLDNLNLKIRKGEKIGIIGKSGSGKTTFVNLLLGVFISNERLHKG